MNSVVEVVVFRLKADVQADDFLSAAQPTFDLLPSFDGYLSRELTSTADGTWIDIVHWTDMSSALKASEQFMANPIAQQFSDYIDVDTMQMFHLEQRIVSASASAEIR